jgi:hypothetical protein
MISAFAFAAALAAQIQTPTDGAPAYSQAYGLGVSVDRGACVYWLTDVGLSAAQLKTALREGYEPTRGLEVLTSPDVPVRCADQARTIAAKLGFTPIRARPLTEKDRLPLP